MIVVEIMANIVIGDDPPECRIFGKLPPTSVFDGKQGPDHLWARARRMAPVEHLPEPFPDRELAQYLHHIAHRVVIMGEIPRSLIIYPQNTSVYFTPDDSLYDGTLDQKR